MGKQLGPCEGCLEDEAISKAQRENLPLKTCASDLLTLE